MSDSKPQPFIKAGYVWLYGTFASPGGGTSTGYRVWREAGILETLLWKMFGRRPAP